LARRKFAEPVASDRRATERRREERRVLDRRDSVRVPVSISVDYRHENTFLFAYATNLSVLGIFIQTNNPEPRGTKLTLEFRPNGFTEALRLAGEVAWINIPKPDARESSPGMGVRFTALDPATRVTLLNLVRRIAYVDPPERVGRS
jgi:uncharacterized protein (TIGR02266 family)